MFLQKNVCYNDEINERVNERTNLNFEGCKHFLFDPRPIETKQTLFLLPKNMSVENATDRFVGTSQFVNDDLKKIFPDVSLETILRNQTVALQHGAHQGVYIPSSQSDMYFPESIPMNHEKNKKNELNLSKNTEKSNIIGSNTFYNNTRTQMKNNWKFQT